MLWEQYVFRRGADVDYLWEQLYSERSVRLLYISGSGFDVRAQTVMKRSIENIRESASKVEDAQLVLVDFSKYELDSALQKLTYSNRDELARLFSVIGSVESVTIGKHDDSNEISASTALRTGLDAVFSHVHGCTDIILDASSLPRVIYLAIMTSLLNHLLPDRSNSDGLAANGVNFQVLVAEDAALDGRIAAEDPSSEIVYVPGFTGATQLESAQEWPVVWFPILGENRVSQLQQIRKSISVSSGTEICPVLPHPSRNPRRADCLLVEYKEHLFDATSLPPSNILYVHESQPFEVYRQLLQAMSRYTESMGILGGCNLVVTPLGSKLITIGAGLACFELRPPNLNSYGIAIPHAEPTRYSVDVESVKNSQPEICCLLLTGSAYS